MNSTKPMSDAEIAEFKRRRPGVRTSLACEGMFLTPEEEALFDEMERKRLSEDEMVELVRAYNRDKNGVASDVAAE